MIPMEISLYNTLSREKEIFKPIEDGNVRLYSCGPTVYDYQHIGNLLSKVFVDTLVRTLKYNDYQVNRVENITDVGHLVSDENTGEDKMEKGARKHGMSAWKVAEVMTIAYQQDLEKLNIIPPTKWAKATDHIEEQIDFIKKLEKGGFTYQTEDGVYFDTARTYVVTMTVNKDGNSGSASSTVTVTGTSSGDGTPGGGGGSTIIGGSTKIPVVFDSYPDEISVGQGQTKTVSFKLENTGKEDSEEAKIVITGINSTWYSSSEKKISAGAKKTVTVKFTIPKNAQKRNYSITIKAYADVCGTKVNGTYTTTSYCEREIITLMVKDPSEVDEEEDEEVDEEMGNETIIPTTASEALAAINSASSKKEALLREIGYLDAINASTSEMQDLLGEGDTELAVANSSYKSENYDDAKNEAGQALLKYNEGLQKAKASVDSYLGEGQSGASSLLTSLAGRVPPDQEANYAEASTLIDQGDDYFANGQYTLAKASYDEAYALLQAITPTEAPAEPETPSGPFSLSARPKPCLCRNS